MCGEALRGPGGSLLVCCCWSGTGVQLLELLPVEFIEIGGVAVGGGEGSGVGVHTARSLLSACPITQPLLPPTLLCPVTGVPKQQIPTSQLKCFCL